MIFEVFESPNPVDELDFRVTLSPNELTTAAAVVELYGGDTSLASALRETQGIPGQEAAMNGIQAPTVIRGQNAQSLRSRLRDASDGSMTTADGSNVSIGEELTEKVWGVLGMVAVDPVPEDSIDMSPAKSDRVIIEALVVTGELLKLTKKLLPGARRGSRHARAA